MKGNEKIIEQLNVRLAEELTASNQYMVHAEMCENWGYQRLHTLLRTRAITESETSRAFTAPSPRTQGDWRKAS